MDLFAQILGMTLIVVGLVGFTVCASLTVYFVWRDNKETPAEPSAPTAASDGGAAAGG